VQATSFNLRLKVPMLVGAVQTALYSILLLVYFPWSRLNTVAARIATGGGLLFGTGLLLSVYRDRLLALLERIKRHEGVFRILSWR
jgi:hypothetical protein